MGDLHTRGVDPLLGENLDLTQCGVAGRREWAMIGARVRKLARAAARWTFSTSSITPGSSAAHFMNAALISVPWMPR
jgi:hypothetical protein